MGQKPRPKPKHLAAKLLAIRQHLGLSQAQIVERLDCNLTYPRISEYERGTREPNLLVLLRYSQIAGLHTEALINDLIDLARFRDALHKKKF